MAIKAQEIGDFCPLLKKSCIRHKCAWFIKVLGSNPQTGEELEHWGCAVEWLPLLLVENSQKTREVSGSVDALRKEVSQRQQLLSLVSATKELTKS